MAIHPPSVPNWDPNVRKLAEEVDAAFPRTAWTSTYPGHGEGSSKGAYAVDFMVSNEAQGDAIRDYLVKHHVRLGIRYLIWWRRIINWGTDGPNAKWKWYFDGNSSNPSRAHTNHVHLSVQRPPKTYEPLVPEVGDLAAIQAALAADGEVYVGEAGKLLQASLNKALSWVKDGTIPLDVDGWFGPKTRAAVARYQAVLTGLRADQAWPHAGFHPDADGVIGAESAARLGLVVPPFPKSR